jgi:hypothetical protein
MPYLTGTTFQPFRKPEEAAPTPGVAMSKGVKAVTPDFITELPKTIAGATPEFVKDALSRGYYEDAGLEKLGDEPMTFSAPTGVASTAPQSGMGAETVSPITRQQPSSILPDPIQEASSPIPSSQLCGTYAIWATSLTRGDSTSSRVGIKHGNNL